MSGTRRRLVAVGAALAGMLLVGVLGVVLPAGSVPGRAPVAVTGTTRLVCPVPEGEEADLVLTAAAGTQGLGLTTLDGAPVPTEEVDGVLTARLPGTSVLTAEGETAGSLAGVVTRAGGGADPGLSQVLCQPAGGTRWLVGLRGGEDQQAAVVLTNPDERQAVVDLTLADEEGLRQVPGSQDLVVAAGSTVVVDLGPLLVPTGAMSVQVQTTTGRVAALGRQRSTRDGTTTSSEWVAPTSAPATSVLLPGVPGGEGARRLVLANPGERRAQVRVEALGASAPFVPAGVAGEVDVAPGGTATVTLDEGFSEDATALRVSGSQPVAATLLAETPAGDLAAVPAAAPVVDSAVGVAPADRDALLVLSSAGDVPAVVQVLPLAGQGAGEEVTVAPGTSLSLTGEGLGRVEVTSGAVHGSVVLRRDGLSSLPLVSTGAEQQLRAPLEDPHLW